MLFLHCADTTAPSPPLRLGRFDTTADEEEVDGSDEAADVLSESGDEDCMQGGMTVDNDNYDDFSYFTVESSAND